MLTNQKVIFIFGPTASGKTAYAVRLAKELGGEIISMDSRQCYRFMDLGTGKDLEEYGEVPVHMIDVVHPKEEYSVAKYIKEVRKVLTKVVDRGKIPVFCGGTGHYLKSLIDGYSFGGRETNIEFTRLLESKSRDFLEQELRKIGLWEIHDWKNDSKRRMARAIEKESYDLKGREVDSWFRNEFEFRVFSPDIERDKLRLKIHKRLKARLDKGMIDEVRSLLNLRNVPHERLIRMGLEYKWICKYLNKEIEIHELKEKLFVQIARYAKRQTTYLRYLEKNGIKIGYFSNFENLKSQVVRWLY